MVLKVGGHTEISMQASFHARILWQFQVHASTGSHCLEYAQLCRKQRQARTGGLPVCCRPAGKPAYVAPALETAEEENTYPTPPRSALSSHPASFTGRPKSPSTSASWVPEFPGSLGGRPGEQTAVNTRRNFGRCGMGKKKKKSVTPATARNPFGIATVSNRPHGAYEPGGKNVAT